MRRTSLVALVLTLALAACAPQPTRVTTPSHDEPANFPAPWYREAAARGQPVFRVDPGSSLVVVEVYRTGPLARLGHDHVVASHDVQGYLDPAAGRADLYLPLDALTVDEPALRAAAHLDTQPTDADIAGTRRNMLGPVLDASHFPFAQLSLQGVGTRPGAVTIDAMLTLHGVTRRVEVPIDFAMDADAIDVAGAFAIRQTQFGIVPLAVLGGAVQVGDEIRLRFHIHARRAVT